MLAKSPHRIVIDALRTTDARQIKGALSDGNGGFCALGIMFMALGCTVGSTFVAGPDGKMISDEGLWMAKQIGVSEDVIEEIISSNDFRSFTFKQIAMLLEQYIHQQQYAFEFQQVEEQTFWQMIKSCLTAKSGGAVKDKEKLAA
jgi:hypothetical protein